MLHGDAPLKILVIVYWVEGRSNVYTYHLSLFEAPGSTSRPSNRRNDSLRKRWFGREEFRFCRSAGGFFQRETGLKRDPHKNVFLAGGNSNIFYFHPEPWGNDSI